MTDSGRRYTDREMAVILRLASEIDTRGTGSVPGYPSATGRTIDEIEDIAVDAGIERGAVRAAVAALEQQDEGFLPRLVGGPTLFRFERTVAGELPAHEARELINSVQWTLAGQHGEVNELGETVTWQHKTDEGPFTQVEVTRKAGQTRIRVLAKHENPAAWIVIGTGAATIVGTGLAIAAIDSTLLASVATFIGMAGVNLLGARAIWRRHVATVRRRLHELADKLEQQARTITSRT